MLTCVHWMFLIDWSQWSKRWVCPPTPRSNRLGILNIFSYEEAGWHTVCRYDLFQAVASNNKNVVLSICLFRSMTSLLGLKAGTLCEWRSEQSSTGPERDPTVVSMFVVPVGPKKIVDHALMRGPVAGSYFQCWSTDAMEVWWEIIVDGA